MESTSFGRVNGFIISGARRDFSYRPGLSRRKEFLSRSESWGPRIRQTQYLGDDVLHSYFWWWEVICTFLCRGGYRRFFCVHFGEQLSHPTPPFPILGFFGFLTKSHKETIRPPRDPPHYLNGDMTPPWTQKHQTNPPGFWET